MVTNSHDTLSTDESDPSLYRHRQSVDRDLSNCSVSLAASSLFVQRGRRSANAGGCRGSGGSDAGRRRIVICTVAGSIDVSMQQSKSRVKSVN